MSKTLKLPFFGLILWAALLFVPGGLCLGAGDDRNTPMSDGIIDCSSNSLVLVTGGIKCLTPLSHTDNLDGHPILAFTEQNKGHLLSLLSSMRAADNGQILFANSNLDNLVIEMAREGAVRGQTPAVIEFRRDREAGFTIGEDGVYEIWASKRVWFLDPKDQKFLSIGKTQFALPFVDTKDTPMDYDQWVKVADVKLQKNKYIIDIVGLKGKSSKKLGMPQILIVSKEKLQEYKNVISDMPMDYLFYVDPERAGRMAETYELHQVESYKNPFILSKNQFCLSKSDNYVIKAYIRPKRHFVPVEESVVVINSNVDNVSQDAITGWTVRSENVSYKQTRSDEGLRINAYFDKKRDVLEDITLTKAFPDLRLRDNRCMVFSCLVEEPDVQDVRLHIYFKDEKGKKVSKRLILRPGPGVNSFNIYKEIKRRFHGKGIWRVDVDNLYIRKIRLIFRKKNVDASKEGAKGYYSFTFKDLAFSDYDLFITNFEDMWATCSSPEYFYYFAETAELKKARYLEELPHNVRAVYRLNVRNFVDLKENPILNFSFQRPAYRHIYTDETGRENFPREFKVVLDLDFNGNEKPDAGMELFLPATPKDDFYGCLNVKAYEKTKKRFPGMSHYNLLGLSISHPYDIGALYNKFGSRQFIKHERYTYSPSDLEIGSETLTIDGKTYKLPEDFKNHVQDGLYRIDYEEITLKEGNHTLEVVQNDKFSVEMVEIRRATGGQISSTGKQNLKINCNKVNPTRYIVGVEGAKGPFTLVFNESFHDGWKAYVRQRSETGNHKVKKGRQTEPWSALWSAWNDKSTHVAIKGHFAANGYANGWVVSEPKKSGDRENFQLVIEYEPQKLFEAGLLISVITLLGCIGYLGRERVRRKKGVGKWK